MNDFNISFIAGLDETKSKAQLNQDINAIQKSLKELELKVKLDSNQVKSLENQLNNLRVNLRDVSFDQASLNRLVSQINNSLSGIKLQIPNLNDSNLSNQAKQIGQQIGNNISQGIKSGAGEAETALKSFSKLFGSMSSQKVIFDAKGLIDEKRTLEEIRKIYSEFGNVKITNKVFDSGELKSFQVNIQQVNGDLKDTRKFMMELSADGRAFVLPDSVVKGSESIVHHLNEAKNALNKIETEEEKLANALADGREKIELMRKSEEKRQQLAQNNAINKSLDAEYKARQRNIEATSKQLEKNKQAALAFTQSASKKLSSAVSKYSYGDTSKADSMIKQMNHGLANFGDLSNIQKDISSLSSSIDKIISDLQTSHQKSLQLLNEEIKAEETLQSQKDAFTQKNINGIDFEIQKREEEAKIFSSMLQSQMQEEKKFSDQANKIKLSMGVNGDTTSQIDMLRNNFTKLGLSADEVKTKMSGVDTEVKTLQSLMNSGADHYAIVTQFEKLQSVLTQTQNDLKQTRSDYSLLATEQQRLSLANTIEAWNQKNTRATKEVKTENDRYVASLRDLNTQMTKIDFNKINNGFKQNENSMRTLNRLGASLKDQMKQAANSFTQWISVSSAIMGVVYNTKQAVSELKDLDDILTEISKTSDLTTEQLKSLGDTAFDTASKYGKKASDYLTGVQEMYRAGFDNAEQMAELSVLAQSAGDMDATLSNNYLMATNAAYKYKGNIEDLNSVLDSQNYITNNAAISMKDIADATTETASVAAEFGVQIDELSALIATATANTRESGSEVGTALKSILINLQDTTSKPVTDTFDALGISMTKVVDGAEKLKTPIELIYELADAYNSLPEGDVMRANILNDIGQKRHAKVCVVI